MLQFLTLEYVTPQASGASWNRAPSRALEINHDLPGGARVLYVCAHVATCEQTGMSPRQETRHVWAVGRVSRRSFDGCGGVGSLNPTRR